MNRKKQAHPQNRRLSRILVWLVIIAAAAVLFLFGNDAGTLIVLISVIFVPVLSVILNFIFANKVKVILSVSSVERKNNPALIKITATNSKILAVMSIGCIITLKNAFTGEYFEQIVTLGGAGRTSAAEISITPLNCGKITIALKGIEFYDLFGLFKWRKQMETSYDFTVLPELYKTEITLSRTSSSENNDKYSTLRPGSDPSETFAIREYVPGDPIKNIHWKLSEKQGRLMVREMSLPDPSGVLLVFLAGKVTAIQEDKAAYADAAAAIIASTSAALTAQAVSHSIAYYKEGKELVINDIADDRELDAALVDILSNSAYVPDTRTGSEDTDSKQRNNDDYLALPLERTFSHITIISAAVPMMTVRCDARMTLIIPSSAQESGAVSAALEGGFHIHYFTASEYDSRFSRLTL